MRSVVVSASPAEVRQLLRRVFQRAGSPILGGGTQRTVPLGPQSACEHVVTPPRGKWRRCVLNDGHKVVAYPGPSPATGRSQARYVSVILETYDFGLFV